MLIGIVAVTKAFDGFCIAGVNALGELIRPIYGKGNHRFWPREKLTHDGEFIKCGDVWELDGRPFELEYPNHTEDFLPTTFRFRHTLNQSKFFDVLSEFAEDKKAFSDTVNAHKRSLCLVSVDSFTMITRVWNNKTSLRMGLIGKFSLNNPKTQDNLYPVKDCRWLGLMNDGNIPPQTKRIFICIGLATPTPYDRIEYPQVVGVHTLPCLGFTATYPD